MDGFAIGAGLRQAVLAMPLRVGVIGAGAFGGYHAGKVCAAADARLVGVTDPDLARAQDLAARHGAAGFASAEALIDASDAVIVAAPAAAHAELAALAISAGRHVLVEKPLAHTGEAAERLVRLAHRHGVVLQAGHQERFVMDALGLLGTAQAPRSITCVREGPSSGRGLDVSVTLDLMIHDLDLVASMFGCSPLAIEAWGSGAGGRLDTVEARLTFAAGEAQLRASRAAPQRQRTLKALYEDGVVEVDFLTRTVRNDTSIPLNDDFAARCPDPLGASVAAFLAAAAGRAPCPVPGEAGAAAVRLAEAIDAAAMRTAQAA